MQSVLVHYSTGKHNVPATPSEVPFASLLEAKEALPTGYGTAFIFEEDGTYFYDGRYRGFGWQFFPKAALVSVPS